jgi:1-acyl-sn-glycerol-3-phosphate acyltransferase
MRLWGQRRWQTIAAAATVFLICLGLATRLPLDERISSMLPDTDPTVSGYRFMIERFWASDSLYIDIGTEQDSDTSADDIVKVSDALYESLQESGMFASIHYPTSREKMLGLINTLGAKKARLLSADDLSSLSRRLGQNEIRRLLAESKRRLTEPSSPFMVERLRADPLGIGEILVGKFESLNPVGANAQVRDGRIWSNDLKHMLIIALPKSPAVDTARSRELVSFLGEVRRKVSTASNGTAVRVSYAGAHIATLDNTNTIRSDVSRTLAAIFAGIVILCILFFRRRTFFILVFLPAIFGLAVASALFALFRANLSSIAIGCVAVLVCIAVNYGVQILYWIDDRGSEGGDPRATVRALLLPLSMGACTTVCAFICLYLSTLPWQRQMGLFAAAIVFSAVVFAILVLRHLVPASKDAARKQVIPLSACCEKLLAWRLRHRIAVGVAGICILGISVFGLFRVCFEGDVEKLNRLSPANRPDEERLFQVWGRFSPTTAMVHGKSIQEALEANDRLAVELESLSAEHAVSSFSSISTILPSAKTQEQNWKRWNSFWSGQRRAEVRARFEEVSSALEFTPVAFDPFFESIDKEPLPVTPEDFEGTGLGSLIQSRIASDRSECWVLTDFVLDDKSKMEDVTCRIRSAVPSAIVMDKKNFVEHITSLVKREFARLGVAVTISVVLCLFFFFRRIELVLVAILPVVAGALVTFGILGCLGMPVNLISLLFIVFVFGIGVDFSIFLFSSRLSAYRGGRDLETTTWGSVVICALTTVLGFAALTFAKHPVLSSIGTTGLIGMASSLSASMLLVQAISKRLLPREGRYGTPSLKTLGGALWAFVYLGGLATLYNWFLRFLVYFWYSKDVEVRRRFVRKYLHIMAVGLLKSFPYLDSKRIYIDAQSEKFKKPAVIVSNHVSAFDIMIALALPADMVMLVKDWVWKAPFIGCLVRDAGYILVGANDPETVMEENDQQLKKGVSIMVFPEGSRSPDGKMQRFHKGAFEIAIRTGSDILPVLLSNSQSCIPYGAFWVGDHQTVIHVLPRVTTENFDYSLGARELGRYVKQKMLAHQHADWRLAQSGKSFWHNIRSLYNYRGAYVESYVVWKLRLDPIYKHIDELAPEEGVILDLGCGYGLMSNILARKSLRRQVLGVDFDEQKIGVAKRTALASENVQFELKNIMEWEYPPADCIVMVDVLHYWQKEKQYLAIGKACASLKTGGLLVFRDACTSSSWRHYLTHASEQFSIWLGCNRRGDSLCFGDREFYLHSFQSHGLRLQSEHTDLGRGSNVVFVFRKDT